MKRKYLAIALEDDEPVVTDPVPAADPAIVPPAVEVPTDPAVVEAPVVDPIVAASEVPAPEVTLVPAVAEPEISPSDTATPDVVATDPVPDAVVEDAISTEGITGWLTGALFGLAMFGPLGAVFGGIAGHVAQDDYKATVKKAEEEVEQLKKSKASDAEKEAQIKKLHKELTETKAAAEKEIAINVASAKKKAKVATEDNDPATDVPSVTDPVDPAPTDAPAEEPAEEMISMEEEAMQLAEAIQEDAEVSAELAQADRIMEVSDALEELAEIADSIPEATSTEVRLMEIVGDMAAAGTTVEPEAIVPSLESFVGKRISTEGLRDKARVLWQNIQKFLREIWEKVTSFVSKITSAIPSLRRASETLKKRIAEIEGQPLKEVVKGKDLVFPFNSLAFSVNYTPVKTEEEFIKAVSETSKVVKYVFKDYVEANLMRGKAIASTIGKFEISKAEEIAGDLRNELAGMKLPAVVGGGKSNRFPGFETNVGYALLGNKTLASKTFVDSTDTSLIGSLSRFRQSTVDLIETSEKGGMRTSAAVMLKPLSVAGMKKLLADVDTMLAMMEDYKTGVGYKNTLDVRRSIETASNKATNEMAKVTTDDAGAMTADSYYRALIGFNHAFIHWTKNPSHEMLKNGLQTSRAAIAYVKKSTNCYVPKVQAKAVAAKK